MKKIKGMCRYNYIIDLPCNWMKEQRCGIDGKACIIKGVIE